MECQDVSQEANTLTVKFCYSLPINTRMQKVKSSAYICGALSAEFEFAGSRCTTFDTKNYADYCLTASVRFHKLLENDDLPYTCKITSTGKYLLVNELRVCNDQWHQIAFYKQDVLTSNSGWNCTIAFTLKCEISVVLGIFASIYDDTQSTDFKLCGEDGSVEIHKPILAAFSPVLQTMVVGEWKEAQEGKVTLQGVSLQTLRHLKDFMYLNKLPETGLQELYLLASYYMMSKLMVACCAKLLNKLNTDDVFELSVFATTNRIGPLYVGILKTMGAETAKINKLALKTKWMDIGEKSNTEQMKESSKEEAK